MLRSNFRVCVPTYNRKEPKCLEMLELDKELELDLFVRQELIDSGFYDELAKRERVHLHSLGEGVTCIGDTRERIFNWCKSHNVKYCAMFDDGMCNVINTRNERLSISNVFNMCVDIMEKSPLKDKYAGFCYVKRVAYYADGRTAIYDDSKLAEEDYFLFGPFQTCLWNIDIIKEHDLHVHTLEEVGFEDCAFFADCLKKGLVFGSRKYIKVDGVVPNETKSGGNHTLTENIEKKYDKQIAKCMEYIGNMYGVYVKKRYRSYAKGLLGLITFDLDYFREALVLRPEENKTVIERGFQI